MPELTARADGSDAELRLTTPGEGRAGCAVEVTRGGRTVVALRVSVEAGDRSTVAAKLDGTTAELELTGEQNARMRGTVGGVEVSDVEVSGLEERAELRDLQLPDLSALPLGELADRMRPEIEHAAGDDCEKCNAECGLKYVECLVGCGDPGTPSGAICWLRCIFEADRCVKACPCQPRA